MTTETLASVIIPTFNRSALLAEAVQSVINQTYRPIELIIIDDGSTDDTGQHCVRLQQQAHDREVSFFYHKQTNGGVSSARNTGMMFASGEFIQFLDSDDLLHPQKLECQIKTLVEHPECGLCLSNSIQTNDPKQITWASQVAMPDVVHYEYIDICMPAPTPTSLYKTELLRKTAQWDIGLTLGEDRLFLLRALKASGLIATIKTPLVIFRQHEGPQLSSRKSEQFYKDKLKSQALLIQIAQDTPASFQQAIQQMIIDSLFSSTMYTMARGPVTICPLLLDSLKRYALSNNEKRRVRKLQQLLSYPRIIRRIALRARWI